LQYSQQWRAADIFRAAPIAGPARIGHGARRAVLCFLALPAVLAFGLLAWSTQRDAFQLLLIVPGLIAMPVYALLPGVSGAVPFSQPADNAKSTGRGLAMIGTIFVAMAIAAAATLAWTGGVFWYFVAAELLVAIGLYAALVFRLNRKRWPPLD
jgi:hypothetical protein